MTNLARNLDRFADRAALVTEDGEITRYRELLALGDGLAAAVKPRSVALLVCSNVPASVAAYLGILRRDAVPLLVNETVHDGALSRLCEAYEVEYVILPQERAAAFRTSGWSEVSRNASYVAASTGAGAGTRPSDELALLLPTSGSTGGPKFVRLSHRNLSSNAASIAESLAIAETDAPITTMPMSYSYGLSIINSHLLQGARLILTKASLMEKRFWETLARNRATGFGGVPYIYEMLKKLRFERMDLPSITCLTQAGGKLSKTLSAEFAQACARKGIRYFTMYGQTEATARMALLPPELAVAKAGSVGVAIPGGELALEGDGELIFKGPNVCLGYAECRADLARGDDNGGVLRTGDLATKDSDGCFTIIGRKKRFLKIYGNRVSLDEVELLLKEAGFECACAGVDDQMKVFLAGPQEPSRVRAFLSERTGLNPAAFTVKVLAALPRAASGKVLYSELC